MYDVVALLVHVILPVWNANRLGIALVFGDVLLGWMCLWTYVVAGLKTSFAPMRVGEESVYHTVKRSTGERRWCKLVHRGTTFELPASWLALFILCLFCILVLLPFFLFHVYLLLTNRTTLEYIEGMPQLRLADVPLARNFRLHLADTLRRSGELDRPAARDANSALSTTQKNAQRKLYNVGAATVCIIP
ncbi:hypothetical protein MVES_003236 [Malassezia vespertilionis]|uniref:Uncharacterized protein n=1 Tax=Malassezia vespertilionis TaxID=2020962 RepID=A0A2N1J8C0_9BASI|nr:hypothetical protein MVES_003236 [Malassezia vespertilionis]